MQHSLIQHSRCWERDKEITHFFSSLIECLHQKQHNFTVFNAHSFTQCCYTWLQKKWITLSKWVHTQLQTPRVWRIIVGEQEQANRVMQTWRFVYIYVCAIVWGPRGPNGHIAIETPCSDIKLILLNDAMFHRLIRQYHRYTDKVQAFRYRDYPPAMQDKALL